MKETMKYEPVYEALMADHHLGYSVPVGGVIAYEGKICVNGVGFDIACGNKAVLLDCDPALLKANIYRTRIQKILKAHERTIKILHRLTPIGICMADDRTFDPYKD
jgi:RNA-splicing ligase RtcB